MVFLLFYSGPSSGRGAPQLTDLSPAHYATRFHEWHAIQKLRPAYRQPVSRKIENDFPNR